MRPPPPRVTAGAWLVALLGSPSLHAMAAHGQTLSLADMPEVPETVLVTGSLIRGTTGIGTPVTNFNPQDFTTTGSLTTADLFRTFPAASVQPAAVATNSIGNIERGVKVNIRGLDTVGATRSLLMVDGMRFPAQGGGQCVIDPSIIPAVSLDHIDVLLDGASAIYGADAISGVINIILRRNFDGAVTQAQWTTAEGGKSRYAASALWGRTWDGGQVTLSYEWYNEAPILGTHVSKFGTDHTPWGFDDRRPLGSSVPATLSVGTPSRPAGGNVGASAQLGHNCTNCYAVPLGTGRNFVPGTSGLGPTAPFSASTLDWSTFNNAANSGTNGVRNQFDPYDIAWYDAAQERNGGHVSVDQRLSRNISFYGSGFYSNRRAKFLNPSGLAPAANNLLFDVAVPTFNPYYPTGGAPFNLRVNYNIGIESSPVTAAYEVAQRYQLGLNVALPAGWSGRLWYAVTNDQNFNNTEGATNRAALSAALGWTINATRATGSAPAIATWTKPANVPYLNLFCDPTAYKCNSDSTIAYVEGIRSRHERFWLNEKGAQADGPLFELPGGTVKAAVGATYTSFRLHTRVLDNTGASNLIVPYQSDAQARQVWAVFTQINVPLFSEMNARPLLRRLDLEFSWRHDQYSDVKGTSNPKLAFNWLPIEHLTIRGTWGTSFRAPTFGELSPLSNVTITGQNLNQFAAQPSDITTGCTTNLPPVGSGAWKVQSSSGNGMPGSAAACVASLVRPAGIAVTGSSGGAEPIRAGGFNGWTGLKPEQATNWTIGFDYAPIGNFLGGLSIHATYYTTKITGILSSFSINNSSFNDPNLGFAFLVPTDWAASGLPGAAGCTNNLLPTTCAPFQEAVTGLLTNPRSTLDPQARTLILWINDGGTFNKGWSKLDGIDFQASYDWDWNGLGAWSAGVSGTFYLHQRNETVPGALGTVIEDAFHMTLNAGLVNEARGVQGLPNARYRARLGWTNGPWSLIGFMDYQAHFYHRQQAPPNVNGSFCASNGSLDASGAGGTYLCAIDDYTNIVPSYYTFDLSIGYNTMDAPATEYLRNIGVQLVIQNIMDRHGSYAYWAGAFGAGNLCTCDPSKKMQGRTVSLIVTKEW